MTKEKDFLIASPEKALIDAIYLASKKALHLNFEELDYSEINKRKFRQLSARVKYIPFQNLLRKLKI